MQETSRRGLVSLAVLILAGACVGPSRSDGDYRQKVANAAEATRSAVETARLVTRAAAEGKAPGRYSSLVLSEAEVDASSIAESFKRVQPPSRRIQHLREELSSVLDSSTSSLAALRIAAYQGDGERLSELAADLPRLSSKLARFEHLAAG